MSSLVEKSFAEKVVAGFSNLDKPVYIFRGQRISFRELEELSNHIASYLQGANDLSPGDKVILSMDDSPVYAAAILALSWSGLIPVPLNPKLKIESFKYVLTDCEAKAVFCEWSQAKALDEFNSDNALKICVNDLYAIEKDDLGLRNTQLLSKCISGSRGSPEFKSNNSEFDFLQYTSGTTGSPKGVMHKFDGLWRHNQSYARSILGINESSVLYSTSKMFFGYGFGVSFIFGLCNNCTTILDDRWPTTDIVVENINTCEPTHIFSVPVILAQIEPLLFNEELKLLSNVKLISAGSPLSSTIFNCFKERHALTVLDGIGATETGHIFLSNTPEVNKAGSTGRPIAGYEVSLDTSLSENNSTGVLLVKGPTIAKGYLNLPAKTNERFSNGWYRTGDIFSSSKDGGYSYIGREDDLFKAKGRWVTPLPIENLVTNHFKMIIDAAMVPVEGASGELKPVLAVVNNDHTLPTESEEIRSILQESFPNHMQPDRIVNISELPRNENGKVVRGKIPKLIMNVM